jgi:hypothetical protein
VCPRPGKAKAGPSGHGWFIFGVLSPKAGTTTTRGFPGSKKSLFEGMDAYFGKCLMGVYWKNFGYDTGAKSPMLFEN